MSEPPRPESRVGSALVSAGTVGTRVWDFVARLATIGKEHERLSQEQDRLARRIETLAQQVFEIAKDVQRISGQLSGFEKRLDDKDKMVEAIITVRVRDAVDKLRTELREKPAAD